MNKIEYNRQRILKLIERLEELYPEAHCTLSFKNTFELLICTQLSAQSTDARVNIVTPALFKRFPRPQDFAEADVEEIEKLILEDRIKNTNTNESDSNDSSVKIEYGVILGVAFAVISIGIGLFMSLRKETSEK